MAFNQLISLAAAAENACPSPWAWIADTTSVCRDRNLHHRLSPPFVKWILDDHLFQLLFDWPIPVADTSSSLTLTCQCPGRLASSGLPMPLPESL
jgi:hypothetical protein